MSGACVNRGADNGWRAGSNGTSVESNESKIQRSHEGSLKCIATWLHTRIQRPQYSHRIERRECRQAVQQYYYNALSLRIYYDM